MEMKFNAVYGDEEKEVTLKQIFGAGDGWHIYIDNYAYGEIILGSDGVRRVYGTRAEAEFTSEDKDILIAMVVELEKGQ